MKTLVIALFLISLSMTMCAQKIDIDNNNIDYSIMYVSIKLDEGEDNVVTPSKYVVVIDLTEEQKGNIKKLTLEDWQILLENKNTDFAINLLLYSLFDKDAILLNGLNRDKWVKCCKSKDIDYWLKLLKCNDVIFE